MDLMKRNTKKEMSALVKPFPYELQFLYIRIYVMVGHLRKLCTLAPFIQHPFESHLKLNKTNSPQTVHFRAFYQHPFQYLLLLLQHLLASQPSSESTSFKALFPEFARKIPIKRKGGRVGRE
jgi:hypothetical protein